MKNFTKSVERKFEETENFITSLSVNNNSVGTPEKEKESERISVSCRIIKKEGIDVRKTTGW